MYEVSRLPSGQWCVTAENGRRLGVFRTKPKAVRHKELLMRRARGKVEKRDLRNRGGSV